MMAIRVPEDPVGLGSYQMDSHSVQRYITKNGCVIMDVTIEVSPGGPYQVSYRSMLPRRNECSNLLVCCNGLSSSHIAFGSVRMEPVFMVLGQSAATAASLSLDEGVDLHGLPYSRLREQLLADGQFLDVDSEKCPPLLPDSEPLKERIPVSSEPVTARPCIVRG